jgi:transcriptional regulator GlxA family with amidase domain
VLSPGGVPFRADSGLMLIPTASLADAPPLDTIVVPGGASLREGEAGVELAPWLRQRAASTRRIASVCTGVYALADSGLLDGKRATTHWRFLADLRRRFPGVKVEEGVIFVEDDGLYTSGGICAGIDLALALVAEDLGPSASLAVAREMVVQSVRAGPQTQYSELMKAQARAPKRLADLVAWIAGHLDADLSVPTLAERAAVSERQLARLFRDGLGESPAAFVERLRLAAACDALNCTGTPVEEVALMVGYRSGDAFARAFARVHGTAPLHFRQKRMSEIVG